MSGAKTAISKQSEILRAAVGEFNASIADADRAITSAVWAAVSPESPNSLAALTERLAPGSLGVALDSAGVELDRAEDRDEIGVRVGTLVHPGAEVISAVAPLLGAGHIAVYTHRGFGAVEAPSLLKTIVIRLLAGIGSERLRFYFADGATVGGAFAFVSTLQRSAPLVAGKAVATSEQTIDAMLTELEEEIASVHRDCLQGRHQTIADFNRHAGDSAEPYRVLFLHGVPSGLGQRAFSSLSRILKTGPQCGVHVVMTADGFGKYPREDSLKETLEGSFLTYLRPLEKGPWGMGVAGGPLIPFTLDPDPPAGLTERVLGHAATEAQETASRAIPLSTVLPAEDAIWAGSSADGLQAPIGHRRSGGHALSIGDKPTAALIAGQSGMGKSNLLHVIIGSLAARYSPSELRLYLIDLKGVEFAEYARADSYLPHAQVVADDAGREFAFEVLEHLLAEKDGRKDLCRRAGTTDIRSYRLQGGELPRILTVIDEFQVLFEEDDQLSRDASALLAKLLREGRAFGIHVILVTQTLSGMGNVIGKMKTIESQLQLRIALKCGPEDSSRILGAKNVAASELNRQGEAIYNDNNGEPADNARISIALADSGERDRLRKHLHSAAGATGEAPFGFSGEGLADVGSNAEIQRATGAGTARRAWLGRPVAIASDISFSLRRESASHLAIVGEGEREANGMLQAACLALAHQGPARFHVADLTEAVDSDKWSWAPVLDAIRDLEGEVAFLDERSFQATLEDLSGRVGDDAPEPNKPEYIIGIGLERARGLSREQAKTRDQFKALAFDAPFHQVHLLGWWRSASACREQTGKPEAQFGTIVGLRAPSDDLQRLMPGRPKTPAEFRALCWSANAPDSVVSFVPYSPESVSSAAQGSEVNE